MENLTCPGLEKMKGSLKKLKYDPLPALLGAADPAVIYFTRRDLLGESAGPIEELWQIQEVSKIIRRQQPDGSFKYPGSRKAVWPSHYYPLLETWKQFRFLIDKF